MNEQIQYIGVADLSPEEQATVQKISAEYQTKFQARMHDLEGITVHVKTHSHQSSKKRYAVHARLHLPSRTIIESCTGDDWNLTTAMHKSWEDVVHQVQHRFKIG